MKRKFRALAFSLVLVMSGVLFTPVLVVYAEATISDVQDSISALSKKLKKAQDLQASLANDLKQINTSLSATQQAIAAAKIRIAQAANDIDRKQAEIDLIQERIEGNRLVLAGLIREIQTASREPFLDALLSGDEVTLALNAEDRRLAIESRVSALLSDIHSSQDQTVVERQSLEQLKQTHEAILSEKIDQKQVLTADQQSTQADLAEQTVTIAELQQKLQKLKSDLSSLLGTVVSTDDVKKAAGIAADATGVRKSFILAELTQESGLGRYTGGCTYKNTRVKAADATAFKGIMKELGYDLNSKKISCAGKIGYGGAMGIAQFMPTTWLGYKSYISGATGHNPPDPWSVTDGVMGMAKKLANGGATSKKGEYNASMLYYCGTTKPASAAIKTACNNYAKNVQSLASGYENN